jgi:sulfur-oxidizing protein SoxA
MAHRRFLCVAVFRHCLASPMPGGARLPDTTPAGMRGVAARYPRLDAKTGELLNVEARIDQCRSQRQGQTPWPWEAQELLSLS